MNDNKAGQVQKRAKEFESYVVGFLKRLGFSDVSGGGDFSIGNLQVDACAAHEDTLLIIECKSAGKRVKRSVRDDIQRIRGRIPTYTRALKQMPIYSKYQRRKFIIAIRNIEFTESDRLFAKENPQVYIWDEQLMEYYADLQKRIGEYAKFGLLSEIDIQPRIESRISVPAFKAKFDGHSIYSFLVEPHKLLRVAYVARREVGNERYYQRILKPDRIGKIQVFLRKGGIFPNNIIVSFTNAPKFVAFRQDWPDWPDWLEFGVITFPETYRSCWIIDGQHRLYAFSDPKMTRPAKIAVTAFEHLQLDRQARFFVEINKEQKPVDPDLIWDLEGDMRPNSSEGIVSQIVKNLAESEPFKGRIYVPLRGKKRRGQLKFSGLCTAVVESKLPDRVTQTMPGATTNPLWDQDASKTVEKVTRALVAYFKEVDTAFSEEQKAAIVFKNTSIELFFTMYERILARLGRLPTANDLPKYVGAFQKAMEQTYPSYTHLRALLERCASRGGRREVVKEFVLKIRDITGDSDFGEKGIIPKDEQELTRFERDLAKFITDKLGVNSSEDLRRVVPSELCERVVARQVATIHEALTLGECIEIIKSNWQSFQTVFLSGTAAFEDQKKVEWALNQVSQYRNKVKHGRRGQIKYNEPEICGLFTEQLRKCMEA